MMPVVLITPIRWSRSPIQTFFLVLLVISGVLVSVGISDSPVVKLIGEPWANIWGGSSAVGAIIALVGAYWKNQITGMLIERSGISLLGLAALYWLATVFTFTKFDGMYTEIMILLFVIICYLQVRYINQHIKMILDAIDRGGQVSG